MVKFFVVLFLIAYEGDDARINTMHSFDSLLECRHFVFSKEYQASLILEYKGKGILDVIPSCERRWIEQHQI